jgi:hypothetical protein
VTLLWIVFLQVRRTLRIRRELMAVRAS